MSQYPELDFLEYVIKAIVEFPDKIIIERTTDEIGVILTIQVSKEDMGRLIGKGGQTAKAIRVLLRLIGAKTDIKIQLKILEPAE